MTIWDLTVRYKSSQSARGKVREGAGKERLFRSRRRAVIMIHGFANSEDEARESYRALQLGLVNRLWPREVSRFADLFAFHWPGDHPGRFRNKASFSTRIGPAETAGVALAHLITKLPISKDLILVAHSLGTRVLLKALETLLEDPAPNARILAAYLLAAAVPEKDCRGEPFGTSYPGTVYEVFHSKRDWVLKFAFPLGQAPFDRYGRAVGRRGGPRERRWDKSVSTGLGHGEYWSADIFLKSLVRRLSPFGVHFLPVRPGEYTNKLEEYLGGKATELPVHTLPSSNNLRP